MNNFDGIAPYYDKLARIVFGKTIRISQIVFFNDLSPNDKVLICGGGTGWILTELDKLDIPIHVEYVEQSKRMIDLTKRRWPFKNIEVEIFQEDIFNHQLKEYDVIITNFFLDVFEPKRLEELIILLKNSLKTSGRWLITDFRKTSLSWHRLLNRGMHVFFKLFCSLESNQLQDYEALLKSKGLKMKDQKLHYNGFISSSVFHLG